MLGYFRKRKSRPRTLLGVAFGNRGIAAGRVRLPRRDDLPSLGKSTWLPHAAGESGATALAAWVEDNRLRGSPTVGVMAPGEYQTLQVEAPAVPKNEMRQAAAWQVRDLIDFPLDQAVIDTYDPPESTQRAQHHVNVVVAQRSAVAERVDELRGAGLEIIAIDIPELVQRNICARLPGGRGGHALLALDEASGLLTLFRDGEQFLARTLEIGVDQLAHEGADAVDTLVLEVQRSFDYFESALSQPPLTALYVYPGVDTIVELVESLQANLANVQCRPVALEDLVSLDGDPVHDGAGLLHAVGAGLRGPVPGG